MILALIFVISSFFSLGATAFAEEAEAPALPAEEIVDEALEEPGPAAAEETAFFGAAGDESDAAVPAEETGTVQTEEPVIVEAAGTITSVEFSYAAVPAAGGNWVLQAAQSEVTLPSEARYQVESARWIPAEYRDQLTAFYGGSGTSPALPDEIRFEGGKSYFLCVTLSPASGYAFSEDDLTFRLNGDEAEMNTADGPAFYPDGDLLHICTENETVPYPVPAAPQVELSNAPAGVGLRWTAVDGAARYRIYYRVAGSTGQWTVPGATSATSYTVRGLTAGTTYEFAVRAIAPDGTTGPYAAKTIHYIGSPSVTASQSARGIMLRWSAMGGAAKYRIYYRPAGSTGRWSIGGLITETQYRVTGLNSGTEYEFAVRAIASDGTTGSYVAARTLFIAAPAVTLNEASNGIRASWGAVGGAARYRVYYREAGSSGSWSFAANTAATSCTVTGLTSGKTYEFAVRALSADGTVTSVYIPQQLKYVASPAVTLTNAANGIHVRWNAVAGASRYRIYYREAGSTGSWTVAVNTAATDYTVRGLTSGKTYEFAVRAIAADGVTGSYIAKTLHYMAEPALTLTRSGTGVRLSWDKITGAAKYYVYYRVAGSTGRWNVAGTVTGTARLITGLKSDVTYEFAVRAVAADGTQSSYTARNMTIRRFLVCIDAGHQGIRNTTREPEGPGSSDTNPGVNVGTYGPTSGKMEYELTLEIALQLRDALEAQGIGVLMIRETNNVDITNAERARIANNAGCDLSIHIHADGLDNTSVRGCHTIIITPQNPYNPQTYSESYRLARAVINNYTAATGFYKRMGGISERDDLCATNWSTIPTCFLEMGFMTNPTEDTLMSDPAFQAKMVSGIANGILEYFGLS